MNKLMATMLGLTLALGSATMFAQEGKTGDTKPATTKTAKSKSHHKTAKKKTTTAETKTADETKK